MAINFIKKGQEKYFQYLFDKQNLSGEKVPVWIADYVLAGYGTGAVMAVPSGDQRDWNFAKHFNLPIVPILDAQQDVEEAADATKEGRYINSGIINGLTYEEAIPKLVEWLEERGLGKGKIQYRLRNAVFSRQRYWGEPVPAFWKEDTPPDRGKRLAACITRRRQIPAYRNRRTAAGPGGRLEFYAARIRRKLRVRVEYHARLGRLRPVDRPEFGRGCTPERPLGAPMVSSEGACAAYYHYRRAQEAR